MAEVREEPILVLELRDEERRQVYFSGVNMNTGAILWSHPSPRDPWWASLSYATNHTLLIQQFDGMVNPDKRVWMAVDVASFEVLWEKDDLHVAALMNDRIYGHTKGNPVQIDLRTGKAHEVGKDYERPQEIQNLVRPFQYLEGTAHFDTVRNFLENSMNGKIVGGIEYREWDGLVFISYYVQEQGLANYLMVVREDGKLLLSEKLDDSLKGLGADTFFILQGCLFYIRNKRELISYQLT